MSGYFYGWYMKCQSDTQTLAVIPAVHSAGKKRTCSIQIITDNDAWTVTFNADSFRRTRKNIFIGANWFGEKGIKLAIHTPKLTVKGKLEFGPLCPLKYDIMGPFSLVPFMECRHSVWSMKHSVRGNVYINGQKYSFHNAWGYWEGDRGHSFCRYYWRYIMAGERVQAGYLSGSQSSSDSKQYGADKTGQSGIRGSAAGIVWKTS